MFYWQLLLLNSEIYAILYVSRSLLIQLFRSFRRLLHYYGFICEAIKLSFAHTLTVMNAVKHSAKQNDKGAGAATTKNRLALGEAIRDQRMEQGLSQARLALMIGSSKSHIWRIETGRVSVGIDDLSRIADALGTTVASLISF